MATAWSLVSMLSEQFIRQLIGLNSSSTIYHECRRCGYSIEEPDNACPQCGSHKIAAYDLKSATHD
jgi:rubrerythrin